MENRYESARGEHEFRTRHHRQARDSSLQVSSRQGGGWFLSSVLSPFGPEALLRTGLEKRRRGAVQPWAIKIQAGIRLLGEIQGHGNPIQDSDRFDAVLKFYRNKGKPLIFDTWRSRLTSVPPTMHQVCGIDRDSVINL